MITDRIGRHEVLLLINHNFKKILMHKKFHDLFLLAVKKGHLSARVMAHTVQLLNRDAYCPINCLIKAEIRAVDSQSDLRILL